MTAVAGNTWLTDTTLTTDGQTDRYEQTGTTESQGQTACRRSKVTCPTGWIAGQAKSDGGKKRGKKKKKDRDPESYRREYV